MQFIINRGRWSPVKHNRELGRHRNKGLELVYVVRGEVSWDYEGRQVHTTGGTVVFSWPWEEHGPISSNLASCDLYFAIIALKSGQKKRTPEFHRDLGLTGTEAAALVSALKKNSGRVLPASPLLQRIITEIVAAEIPAGQSIKAYRLRNLCRALLFELAECVRLGASAKITKTTDRVDTFLARLKAHCDEEWSLERMAEACGLGRTQLASLIKERTGDTPVQRLTRLRIQRAQCLLRETNHSLTEIGFSCGFSTSQYFSKTFRDFVGMPPSQYRESSKKD